MKNDLSICLCTNVQHGYMTVSLKSSVSLHLKDYGETTIAGDPSDRQGEMSPSTVPEFNDQHYEHHSINVSRTNANESSSLLLVVGRDSKLAFERRGKIIMALLYAIQVFYSFFIM